MLMWSNSNRLLYFAFMFRTVTSLAAVALVATGLLAARAAEPASTNAAPPAKPALTPSDLFGSEVIAKGKGLQIKRSQLDEAVVSLRGTAAARGQDLPPAQMGLIEQQLLDRLIQVQLLKNKATETDQTKGKELAEKRLADIKTRASTEEALNRQLKAVGLTQEQLRNQMIEECVAQTVLERELKVNVTDDDVKKFYDDNPAKFEQPEQVRASHILIGTRDATGADLSDDKKKEKRKLADDLLKRARAGEDFAKLAKDYSEDPGSKDRGGEYTFPRGQMVPAFEAAAFALKTNEVSEVVTTQFGYHIIKLSEKIPAKKVEFAKVSDQIRDYLKQQAVQKDLSDYSAKLKKDAGVEILDPKLIPQEKPAEAQLPAAQPPLTPTKTKK